MKKTILAAILAAFATSAMASTPSVNVSSSSSTGAGIVLGSDGRGSASGGTVVGASNTSGANSFGNNLSTYSISAVGGATGSTRHGDAGVVTGGFGNASGHANASVSNAR